MPSPVRTCWSRASIVASSSIGLDQMHPGELVHLGGELGHRPCGQEVDPAFGERADLRRRSRLDPPGQQPQILAGEVGVLLRAGQGELRGQRRLVEDEPGVREAGRSHVPERAEGVEARKQRSREAPAARVQPERGRAGQDPDAVMAPDRSVVHHPFGVVPHPVGIDHPAADGFGDRQHRSVDVVRYSGDQVRRRLPPAQWPTAPDQVEIAADAATGHHHGLSGEAELPDRAPRGRYAARQLTGFQDRSRHAYAACVDLQ